MTYDILYAITAHEQPNVVQDMIQNIFYFNRSSRICIVINGAPAIQSELLKLESAHVRVLPAPIVRHMWTFDILRGYLEIGEYCRTIGIQATYFIPLASNCMFWRDLTLAEVENRYRSTHDVDIKTPVELKGWHWPRILQNTSIFSILKTDSIQRLIAAQHEGAILRYSTWLDICTYIARNEFSKKIQCQTVFEEFLIATLHAKLTGRELGHICHVFWNLPGYRPSVAQIQACPAPCVKRVERNMSDPVRCWLQSLIKNSSQ